MVDPPAGAAADPRSGQPPAAVRARRGHPLGGVDARDRRLDADGVPVNLLALPSVAVRAGYDGSGLPPGVQIIGPRFREDPCLDAAAAVESALGTVTPIDPRGS